MELMSLLILIQFYSNCRNGELEHISFGFCQTLVPVLTPSISPSLSPTLNPLITPLAPRCYQGWTPWMSASVPTVANEGDVETISGLRMRYSFCQEEAMEAIECRAVGEATASQYSGQQTSCNLQNGFTCYHNRQTGGQMCFDYEVRFYCNCKYTKLTLA